MIAIAWSHLYNKVYKTLVKWLNCLLWLVIDNWKILGANLFQSSLLTKCDPLQILVWYKMILKDLNNESLKLSVRLSAYFINSELRIFFKSMFNANPFKSLVSSKKKSINAGQKFAVLRTMCTIHHDYAIPCIFSFSLFCFFTLISLKLKLNFSWYSASSFVLVLRKLLAKLNQFHHHHIHVCTDEVTEH